APSTSAVAAPAGPDPGRVTRPYTDAAPHGTAAQGAPHDPRGDARARTDLGPYFGARANPPQDTRSEGDDA
ncbi:hypothetical protein, partial [Streptomyces sp. NPDC059762]|uniref:hypothetical protein n=1 Tax=Streptomyces sp. NPDC059762 TaxID=3346938 RepID=UPI003664C0C5